MTDFCLPAQLVMPRKTFEFGANLLLSQPVIELTNILLNERFAHTRDVYNELENFWAREHACYIVQCHRRNRRYTDFLPGRAYTYQMLCNLIDRLCRAPARVLEAGCGTSLTCSLLSQLGHRTTGIDIASSALSLSKDIQLSLGAYVDLVHGDCSELPFPSGQFDVVFSLGLLEHRPHEEQLQIVREMVRVTRRYVVLVVPNVGSPIYKTMEESEFERVPANLVYPEEHCLHNTDLLALASACELSFRESSALHIVPPPRMPERYLVPAASNFFEAITRKAITLWNGDAQQTWTRVESECSADNRSEFGWFNYLVGTKSQ